VVDRGIALYKKMLEIKELFFKSSVVSLSEIQRNYISWKEITKIPQRKRKQRQTSEQGSN
jgi:hypothetical protein